MKFSIDYIRVSTINVSVEGSSKDSSIYSQAVIEQMKHIVQQTAEMTRRIWHLTCPYLYYP